MKRVAVVFATKGGVFPTSVADDARFSNTYGISKEMLGLRRQRNSLESATHGNRYPFNRYSNVKCFQQHSKIFISIDGNLMSGVKRIPRHSSFLAHSAPVPCGEKTVSPRRSSFAQIQRVLVVQQTVH